MGTLVVLIALLPLAVSFGVGFLLLRHHRRLVLAQPEATSEGLAIPARAVFCTGGLLGVHRRNSIAPRVVIALDGIHFTAMGRQRWNWDAIAHVEARQARSGWKLLFVGSQRGSVLAIDIPGEPATLAALRALPERLPLTPQAALLRDGSSTRGAEGLRPFSGRLR